ncbi:MAG TPA: GlsB/YeaQ/YmgE family stress response membrane protein [Gammaproteobacteria bacterium]|nr:GlsB/YeaQ/YmgE family stress response membrane protein [Gammaproteobacteria bacterium]
MGIITWIVFGLIAGAVAKLLMPGKDPGGFIVTTLLGVVGAIIGGFIGTAVGLGGVTGFNLGSFIIAVLGAIALLILYRLLVRRGRA